MKERFRLGYVPALDGIRGIAIVLVVIFHAGVTHSGGGFIGVDIFFVLSGFLITSLLLKEFEERNRINFKNFYIRRVLRLVPALLVMLLVFDLLNLLFLRPPDLQSRLNASFFAMFYVSNWVGVFDRSAMTPYLIHTWSLAIEEQFYLTWPLLLLTLLRLHLRKTWLLAFVLALALASWLWRAYLTASGASFARVYYALDTRLDGLLLGCALAILMATLNFSGLARVVSGVRGRLIQGVCVLWGAALVAVFVLGAIEASSTMYWVIPLVNVLTAVLAFYVVAVRQSWIKRLLSFRGLVFIGRISYGFYLWHLVIFQLMTDYLHFSWKSLLLVGTPTAFVVTLISYYLVEQPALKLKTKFRTVEGGREAPVLPSVAPAGK